MLWRCGLRDVLSGYHIQRIPVTECGEPLELTAAVPGHPLVAPAEIDRLTRLVVARPGAAGGGHQTGAAVDITLADSAGTELWMGTAVGEFTATTPARATVTDPVGRRRRLLTRCLTEVGFINYPAEWWHFSKGDRLWAAYGRRPEARFGPLTASEPPPEND